jgi:hypothetical protein
MFILSVDTCKNSAFTGRIFVPQVVYYEQRFVNFRIQQQKLEESYDDHNQSIQHTG